MEWLALMNPGLIPGAVEISAGGNLMFLIGLLTAAVPALLIVRHAFRRGGLAGEAPRLRVFEGGKEFRRRAA